MGTHLLFVLLALCSAPFLHCILSRRHSHPAAAHIPTVPFGMDRCTHCWYVRRRTDYPEQWSSTACPGHACWEHCRTRQRRVRQMRKRYPRQMHLWILAVVLAFALSPGGAYLLALAARFLFTVTRARNRRAEQRLRMRDAALICEITASQAEGRSLSYLEADLIVVCALNSDIGPLPSTGTLEVAGEPESFQVCEAEGRYNGFYISTL
jgi:hypothetical protein